MKDNSGDDEVLFIPRPDLDLLENASLRYAAAWKDLYRGADAAVWRYIGITQQLQVIFTAQAGAGIEDDLFQRFREALADQQDGVAPN